MTKNEFSIIAKTIKTFYPKENILKEKEEMILWYEMVQDIPYEVASTAIKKWVSLNKWSPTVADIREMSADIIGNAKDEWEDAWALVKKAVSNYGYCRTEEALESLPPLVRKITEQLGFRSICMSEDEKIDRANFRNIYNREIEKERKNNIVSKSVNEQIRQIQEGKLNAIETGGQDCI